jgi:hypothetical protein
VYVDAFIVSCTVPLTTFTGPSAPLAVCAGTAAGWAAPVAGFAFAGSGAGLLEHAATEKATIATAITFLICCSNPRSKLLQNWLRHEAAV